MKLNWKLRLFLRMMKWQLKVPMHQMDPLELSQMRTNPNAQRFLQGKLIPAQTRDQTIPSRGGPLPVRLYLPRSPGKRPLILFFHGGGWMIGDLDGHDNICRRLCRDSDALVISVAYRLAPAHKFPAAVEDAYDALLWAAENAAELGADPGCLFVAGDSAGGNLAAVAALMARDLSGPAITGQILIYPSVDSSRLYPSKERQADGPVISMADMLFFVDHYQRQESDRQLPYLSPMNAESHAGLPPALIITAGYDPLRDEGAAYGDRLMESGVQVTHVDYPDMVHGFLSFPASATRAAEVYPTIKGWIGQQVYAEYRVAAQPFAN